VKTLGKNYSKLEKTNHWRFFQFEGLFIFGVELQKDFSICFWIIPSYFDSRFWIVSMVIEDMFIFIFKQSFQMFFQFINCWIIPTCFKWFFNLLLSCSCLFSRRVLDYFYDHSWLCPICFQIEFLNDLISNLLVDCCCLFSNTIVLFVALFSKNGFFIYYMLIHPKLSKNYIMYKYK